MIVDLAVVGDVERAVFIGHRLVAGSDVDDAEAAVAQADAPVDENPFIVRTAMSDHIAHAFSAQSRQHDAATGWKTRFH